MSSRPAWATGGNYVSKTQNNKWAGSCLCPVKPFPARAGVQVPVAAEKTLLATLLGATVLLGDSSLRPWGWAHVVCGCTSCVRNASLRGGGGGKGRVTFLTHLTLPGCLACSVRIHVPRRQPYSFLAALPMGPQLCKDGEQDEVFFVFTAGTPPLLISFSLSLCCRRELGKT